jgi:heptosyltransferase-2
MFFRLPFRFYQAAFFIRPRITDSSFSFMTFSPRRITTSSARRQRAYTRIIQENPAQRHEAHKMASILEAIGHSTEIQPVKLYAGDADRKYMETILHANGVEPGDKLAVIHPSSGLPQKCWPRDRFAFVADALIECDMKVAFIAAPHEKELVDDIRGQMQHPDGAFYFSHKLTVLLALFERATLLFSNESGPTHLAAATDLPITTIFGPTDPSAWKPVREKNLTLLSKKELCKCSDVRYCDLGWPCIRGITVEEVLHALEQYV